MELQDLAYIDETGFHFADYPTFLQFIQEKYRGIYGADVYLEADSQDGQWLGVQALCMYQTAANQAATFNSFSPVTAQGVGLSRQVKLNGLNRRVPTKSTVDLTIVGQAGTVLGTVGAPAVAIDTLDQKWNIPIGTTIPGGGTIVATAEAQEEGAVQAASNTVNRIFTPTLGWQTVDNADAATAGEPVETDAELRARQAVSTANPSLTVFDGTVGAVANLPGVTAVKGYENDTDATDGDGLPPHSISLVVAGGDVTEICQTIQIHKTPGCGTYGDVSETVYDAHGMPLLISFFRPTPITIIGEVVITTNVGYSADYEVLIQNAVAAAIEAFGIGSTILYTKLFLAAYLQGTPAEGSFDVVSIEIAKSGDPLGAANIALDFDEQPICDGPTDITITT